VNDQSREDSVTVAAATFSALCIGSRILGKDFSLSSDVPFGIVKPADEDDKEMELTAFGSDAQPAISAEAQEVPRTD
jgi:hypothetical protein